MMYTALALCLISCALASYAFKPQLKFIWHCFLRPLGVGDQKSRLDQFYRGQADIYDTTRNSLLRGRNTMLRLSASHISVLRSSSPMRRLVWVDIGGGTELMDKYFAISSFDTVYLVDLCEPLLEVARKRFAAKGWKNVIVLCQDASQFSIPERSHINDSQGSVSFVTLSYSLSMIPNYYVLLDRINHILSPQDGLLGVVDFYTAGKSLSPHERAIGGAGKECGWLARWFWQIWFDFDHVSLEPSRRAYLEYKFGTVKSYNGRNQFIFPLRIPYYIWLGRPRSCDVTKAYQTFKVEEENLISNRSPVASQGGTGRDLIPLLNVGKPEQSSEASHNKSTVIEVTLPLSSFHYQIQKLWRLPYCEQPVHKEFRTFIYSFTWEDPIEDMKHLNLSCADSMLVITSAGDNALHYAIEAQPKRIHCVDMNPCQGHLLELKLAAIQSLNYEDFFALFGEGKYPNFRNLLDSNIAPYLSSIAYQFWRRNGDAFSTAFYLRGYSGWALRLAKLVFSIGGVSQDVERMCDCDTLEEQEKIWKEKIRPVLLNPFVIALLGNPVFCWNALGVPLNQRRLLMEEGSIYDFICHTLDPLASKYLFKTGAYFYLLALLGHYTPESCPAYLTRAGFNVLKANNAEVMEALRLHTDSIVNVLQGLKQWSLTRALIMDHLDWFSPGSNDVVQEIQELHRVLTPGGVVFWRSASTKPWYNTMFEQTGFEVMPISIRTGSTAIDRVNMYASCWKGLKI